MTKVINSIIFIIYIIIIIYIKDIVKSYGNHKAVDHLSFSLEKGNIYGFLGPNGAGKSTTMNIMTGYIAANEGTVTIDGHDILKEPEEAKKKIGYLPEIPPLYNDMTVDEYLSFVADLEKILKMTMLGDYGKRMIRNLSKGYKQRVGLAQALVGFPEVIILDEPTVGLDPQQIIEIRNLIKELKEDHVVILSSHILSEVNAVCDHVLIISHGKLAAQGTPKELEEKFQGQEHIKMSILGTEAKIKGALAGISGISNVSFEEEVDNQGGVHVDVTNDGKEDIRADIARALAGLGLPVLSMELEKKTLEDVFLEVTQSTPGSEEKPKRMMRLAKDVATEAEEKEIEEKEIEEKEVEENTEDIPSENPEDDEK